MIIYWINPWFSAKNRLSLTKEIGMKESSSKLSSLSNYKTIYEQLWLSYFNESLYKKGVITEEQRRKMSVKIKARPKR